jgi:hypothetical protein
MLEVKVLRKRRVEDPSEKEASVEGVMFPATWRRSVGAVTPIPIRPLEPMLKKLVPEEDATVKRLERDPAVPEIARRDEGVDDPTPMLPFCRIVKSCVPVEDATENGLTPPRPCTLKVIVAEVALIPAIVPLSIRVEVPRVVADSHRVAKPDWPPVMVDAEIPRVEVATQRVVVPVV